MTPLRVEIGGRPVGDGAPVYIVAEIGINHNGDMDLAARTIAAAARTGADAVKFQNYLVEDFVRNPALVHRWVENGVEIEEAQVSLFRRCALREERLRWLQRVCTDEGVGFHSTPTGASGLAELVRLGVPVLKNGSDFLGHTSFIEAMGQTGIPTVLSTGMATLADIARAAEAFRSTGNDQLILLHCVSSYPAPLESCNLRRIPAMRDVFGCPVGFSDHTAGPTAALAAVALGACWIEKHFTLDRHLPGPDHAFSSDEAELRSLVQGIRGVELALGDSAVRATLAEAHGRKAYRLSCAAARDLPAGHVLDRSDLMLLRPGDGVAPEHLPLLVGRTLLRPVTDGALIRLEDLRT
ncbi:MAG: hypothetical protein RL071_579 [Pseudomonadota bacterium]|jgi:N-acetylneuraminate synthase/N,N'-diacetyllegionaminate synthase